LLLSRTEILMQWWGILTFVWLGPIIVMARQCFRYHGKAIDASICKVVLFTHVLKTALTRVFILKVLDMWCRSVNACVTISKLGQKVTLQGIEPGSLL
jgi:hypothetical protein